MSFEGNAVNDFAKNEDNENKPHQDKNQGSEPVVDNNLEEKQDQVNAGEKSSTASSKESGENLPLKTPIPAEQTGMPQETRYLLFFVYNERAPISKEDLFDLIDQLNKVVTPPERTRIDMVIVSNGGFPHPAYQMMNVVRSKCKKLKAIVPIYAKSAASLMSLAADEIIMGPQSEIGPIDMQMEHPLIENLHISALEGYFPFIQLYGKYATDFFPAALKHADQISQSMAVRREDAVDIAINSTVNFLSPIVSQINPVIVNMCYRALATGETYAYNLLSRYMFKDKPERERLFIAKQTAHALVWSFQNHGQVISREDAKNLNLYIGHGENYDIFDMMYVITKEMLSILGSGSIAKAIRLISMEQLNRLLNVDSYLGYITFIVYKAYSLVFPLRESLKNVTDPQKISLAVRQMLSQSIASLPPMSESEKNDIAQVSLELLENVFIKNFKDENAIFSVAFNRIIKEKAFSKPVSEVIAGRIVEAVKELTETIEIEIDRTPPEVVHKYILQILAFLLVYNIKF